MLFLHQAHCPSLSPMENSNLELVLENFIMSQTQQNKEFMNQNVHTNEMIKQLANKVDTIT